MKLTARRKAHRIGPVRVNRSGLRVTSATCALTPWHRLTIWKAARR